MRKNYNGFTLIELLFVIAIIGVLASLGVSMAEKKAEEFKIKKAALQVQYVLEAGLSYYADNKKWPLDGYSQRYDTKGFPYANNCTDATDTDFRNFCDNYIGSGYKNVGPALRNDPWGQQPYSWWTLSTGGSYTTGRFTVQVKTPNVNIAQRLAALLPSGAYCKPNGTMNWDCVPNADPGHLWVRAYANIPGQVQTHITVDAIGTAEASAGKGTPVVVCNPVDLSNVQCKPNETADLFVALDHYAFHLLKNGDPNPYVAAWIKVQGDKPGYDDNNYHPTDGQGVRCNPLGNGKFNCTFKLCVNRPNVIGDAPYANARALYFIVCKKR